MARLPRPTELPGAHWPRLITDLAGVAGEGTQAVADAGLRAARQLLSADATALVRWGDGRPTVLACVGEAPPSFQDRPAEGAGWFDSRSLAVVSLDPRTDLVASRSGGPGFEEPEMETMRALAELMAWAGGGPVGLGALRGLATRIVASLDLDEVLVSSADAVSRLLRAEIAGVLLISRSGDELEMRCAVGNTKLDTAHLRIRRGQGLAGRVLATGRPVRIDDYGTDPRSAPEFLALSDLEGTCSAMAVPMVRDQRTTGVLCAWRRRRAPFTDEDEILFGELAELCAAAIHNASCHHDLRSSVERLEQANRGLEEAQRGLEERQRSTERDLALHGELTRIAMEGDDLAAVVRSVGALMGSAAAVVTDDGRVLAASPAGSAADVTTRLEKWVRQATPEERAAREPVAVELDGRSWILIAAVRAVGVTFGHLGLGLSAPPTAGDRLAAEQTAVVSALLLAREEAAVTAARRVQSEFVWDLLDGSLPDSVVAGVRARHLGAGFALPARVAAIEVSGLADQATSGGWNPEQLERARSGISRLIAQQLEEAAVRNVVVARRADLYAVVVPRQRGDATVALRRLADALAVIPWPAGLHAGVGVGGPVEHVGRFPEGWREARQALSAAPAGLPGVFEQLGVLQFLLAPTSRAELDAFARRHLGPVVAYDSEHNTELLGTLEAYVAAGCSTRRTAEQLYVHHRTVSYRLQRVEELTGLRLNDTEDRLHVQLALKILALQG